MNHFHKISSRNTDLGSLEAIWLLFSLWINEVSDQHTHWKILHEYMIRSGEMEEDRRGDLSKNPDGNSSIFIPRKTWKWVFLLVHNVIWRQTEMKREGKELSNSWNLSFLTFSHINLHRSTKPQIKIKSTVPLYLTVNTEIINKLYMKHCEENIQNQTVSDTQRERENESSHIVLVKLLLNSP